MTALRQYYGVNTVSHSDGELLAGYAKKGSEPAFRTLVARHVHLVFATALRQSGNRQIAEEITQNVFVALARKAPLLARHETIAGWLHRTTLLESRAMIRSELRRQRREDIAAALAAAGESVTPTHDPEGVIPLLDEGLLTLGEADRSALLLRFLEGRTFAEVGRSLGVTEEAARKRVDRAIDRLAGFFRTHGFPSASNATALIPILVTQGTAPLPTSLLTSVTASGLAAGTGGTIGPILVTGLARLTSLQIIMASIIACLMPIGWSLSGSHLDAATLAVEKRRLEEQQAALISARADVESLRQALSTATALRTQVRTLATESVNAENNPAGPKWSDQSPLVRVSKEYLASLPLYGLRNGRGNLSEMLIEVLQLTPDEVTAIEAALGRFLRGCHESELEVMHRVEPEPADLDGHSREETRVFVFGDLHQSLSVLRARLFDEVGSIIGDSRLKIFRRSLASWMPLDDTYRGLGSSTEIYNEPRRERYHRNGQNQPHSPGRAVLPWGVLVTDRGLSFQSTRNVDDIPDYLLPHLQDWIEEARRANDAPAPQPEVRR